MEIHHPGNSPVRSGTAAGFRCFLPFCLAPLLHFPLILRDVSDGLLRGGCFRADPLRSLLPSVFYLPFPDRCSLSPLLLPFLYVLDLMFLGFFVVSLSLVLLLHLPHSSFLGGTIVLLMSSRMCCWCCCRAAGALNVLPKSCHLFPNVSFLGTFWNYGSLKWFAFLPLYCILFPMQACVFPLLFLFLCVLYCLPSVVLISAYFSCRRGLVPYLPAFLGVWLLVSLFPSSPFL